MRCLCCFILILAFFPAWSQRKAKKKVFITRITLMNKKSVKGLIYELHDDAIRMAVIEKKDTVFQNINITDIKKITSHRKGVMPSTIVGGMLAGAIVGLATYEEPDCDGFCFDFGPEMPMAVGAVMGGFVGTCVGLGLHKAFTLNAKQEAYERVKPQLAKYCYRCN
jgi:hypothetical protein